MTSAIILAMTAETPIHVGVGQAAEAIDLPVAREAVTGFPHVPGSGVKGAWRTWHRVQYQPETVDNKLVDKVETRNLFGTASDDQPQDSAAGTLLFSEARLAMLPVRCTSDSFKLVTCPLIINRLKRDHARLNMPFTASVPNVADGRYLGAKLGDRVKLGLEEREFEWAADVDKQLVALMHALMGRNAPVDFARKLVVLSDKDFKWFTQFGLPVAMRNALNENKIVKTGALWAEETLAPDTVMWSVLSERKRGSVTQLKEDLERRPYIQMGGNETIGQGWFSIAVIGGGNANG